jgi:hypothetical protein
MEQHYKWIIYGSDGVLGGKGCTRMRPEVALARSWPRVPNQWFHGIVRNLAGSEHCRTNVTVGTSSTHWQCPLPVALAVLVLASENRGTDFEKNALPYSALAFVSASVCQ